MSFKIDGLDDLEKQLNKIEKTATQLSNSTEIDLNELFDSSFMSEYTNHHNLFSFLKAGNIHIETQSAFDSIPISKLDKYIKASTQFSSWQEMLDKAYEAYALESLRF